jgi:hypothetical protein
MMAGVASMNNSGLWLPGSVTKEEKIEKWSDVIRKHDPPLIRGATPLVERCMRVFGWSEAFSRRTLRGYRQLTELKPFMNDWQETKLSAPIVVQQMWEQHILDNLNYTDDCFLLFGRVVGHDPDCVLNERATIDRVKTTKNSRPVMVRISSLGRSLMVYSEDDGVRNPLELPTHGSMAAERGRGISRHSSPPA